MFGSHLKRLGFTNFTDRLGLIWDDLELIWDTFGTHLGRFGMNLEFIWDAFGICVRVIWDCLGIIWNARLWLILDDSEFIWDAFGICFNVWKSLGTRLIWNKFRTTNGLSMLQLVRDSFGAWNTFRKLFGCGSFGLLGGTKLYLGISWEWNDDVRA